MMGPFLPGTTPLPAGLVKSTARTVTAVQAKLAGTTAGTRCILEGTGSIPIGIWTSDGTGSFCGSLDFTQADGTEFTCGDADTYDIEFDTGSSFTWVSGLVPLAGTATAIIYHCMGTLAVGEDGQFFSGTAQTATVGLVDGVFFGGGFHMPRTGFGTLIMTSVFHYASAVWRTSVGYNAWPSPTIGAGITTTLDAAGVISTKRSPRGDGTNIQSGVFANYIGDTTGPNAGASPSFSALTDGWSQASRSCIAANYYEPQTSNLALTIKNVRYDDGGR